MIISHKYKFIFIKPTKVGGTSVEVALAKHCGNKDIITPITKYNPNSDEEKYVQPVKNYKDKGFFNHISPEEIKKKIGNRTWNNYYKFTVVRNPWDQTISRYWWEKRTKVTEKQITIKKLILNFFNPKAYKFIISRIWNKKNKTNSFNDFINAFDKKWTNTLYYFDKKGNPICDFYIMYENLDKDYEKACNHLGIPYEKLPKTKNKQRKNKKNYSEYYNKATRKKVYNLFKKEIDFFNYKYE